MKPTQLIGLLLLGVVFFLPDATRHLDGPKQPSITVVIPEVQEARKSVLADFYMAIGEIVVDDGERDSPQLADTAAFAQFHASALGFQVKRNDIGTVPGLADAIDKAFFDNIGKDVTSLNDSTRRKVAEVCNAIAWSILNG